MTSSTDSTRRLAGFLMVLTLALPLTSAAQDDPVPTMQDVFGSIGRQDFQKAVELLDAITAAQPQNGFAWLMMGLSKRKSDDLDGSLAAYQTAAEIPSVSGQALVGIGLVYASRGEIDRAFDQIFLARDSAGADVTSIGLQSGIDELKADPRYRSLFPSEEVLADPFVEPVRIIHEWRGEAEGDQFGWIGRNIGDVDGDQIDDLTTSAPTNAEAGANAGKIYVYSGRTGSLIWSAVGTEKAQLGLGIEAAGDVNGDGVPDVVAGAPGIDEVFAYSGNDGTVILTLEGEAEGDFFGRRVSDAGDWNGDGYDDLIVGAPQSDANGDNSGSAYLFSGKEGAKLFTWRGEKAGASLGSAAGGDSRSEHRFIVLGSSGAGELGTGRTFVYDALSDTPKFIIESDSAGGALGGMFVSVVGDVDADGIPDVYASDWSHNALGQQTGRIYVYSGATGKPIHVITGEAAGDGFGIGVADAGDIDDDGHDDLIVGAWQHASAAPSGGKCYLYSGRTGGLMKTYTGKVVGETFGFDTTGMGDVDGDGHVDLLITSAWSTVSGSRSGRMYVLSAK